DHGDRHAGHFVSQSVHDGARDRIAIPRRVEEERRELAQAGIRDAASVQGVGQVDWPPIAKMPRHELFKPRMRTPAVAPADRRRQGFLADPFAAAPVAGHVAYGWKAGHPSIWRDTHAVDPRAGDDRDPPGPVCAGAKASEPV